MLVATHDILTEKTRLLKQVAGPARWLVKITIEGKAGNGQEFRDVRELKANCRLSQMLDAAIGQVNEMFDQADIDGIEALTGGGFQVFKL